MNESEYDRYIKVMTERDTLQERVAELEAENGAMREFVAVARELINLFPVVEYGTTDWISNYVSVSDRYAAINQQLATNYGMPLPV